MAEETLKIFRLVPDTVETDPNWGLAVPAGEVVVRARSPADARIVAAEAEVDFLDTKTKPGDGVSTAFASMFRDQRLYSVVEEDDSSFSREGPRAVLSGLSHPDPVKHGG